MELVICKKTLTWVLVIPVPLSELDVLLCGLLFMCSLVDRTRGLEEETERKGCREGAENECREPDFRIHKF